MSENIPVPAKQLAAWARFANHVRVTPFHIGRLIAGRELDKAREELTALHMEGAAALVSMERAGAELPARLPYAQPVPLDLLDTPAQRRYCRALRDALEACKEIDKERGHFDPDEPYDGPACIPIVELLAKVEMEVYGPAGRGEGTGR